MSAEENRTISRRLIEECWTNRDVVDELVDDQIAEDDKVTSRWTGRGTHDGQQMGIEPTGKQVTVWGLTLSRVTTARSSRTGRTGTRWGCCSSSAPFPPCPKGSSRRTDPRL